MHASANLSKSRYTTGLSCLRQLWWQVHEPDAPELVRDAANQARLDEGVRVGELARRYVPGGTPMGFTFQQIAEKLACTAQLLASGASVIYGASFLADRVFVEVDILERAGDGWRLIEVKSSTKVKDEHIPDAAVQAYVLGRAGLKVAAVELMHLNRECRFPHLESLFEREDITARVRDQLAGVPAAIAEQLAALEGALPEVPIGEHCREPHECPFRSRCWANLPEHHVSTLYYAGKKAWALVAQGYDTVPEVPEVLCATPASRRQRRSLIEGRRIEECRAGGPPARPPARIRDTRCAARGGLSWPVFHAGPGG